MLFLSGFVVYRILFELLLQEQNLPRRQTNPVVSPSSATATCHPRLSTMPSLTSPRERSSALDLDDGATEGLSKLTIEGERLLY